ncbi:MAG: TIGR04283 family arsenosugar biosynthesis glycosyltransferase [Rhodovarius sp.]|nr:TIGR04283 family arsenosugar biosynthesis glycosyltransferase [Rhodovarius sp.]MDW8315651.1 TIGR04283 family arsenosugar biosynthesis glycosyltransferase [Rhodovarius sp.]
MNTELAIVIPTWQAAASLPATLECLREWPAPIVVADAESPDGTAAVAEACGAQVVQAPRGRGAQLIAGAAAAPPSAWLLFLHADTRLEPGWAEAARRFMAEGPGVAHFAFALDDDAPPARRLERAVAWRCRALGLPYGDQGLLIHRSLYEAVGGYRPLPLMEDVDLILRLRPHRPIALPARAVTSAEKWRRQGYLRRSARNLLFLSAWFAGVPPRLLARWY